MLVICNGAPKTGSTWLMHLVRYTNKFVPVPSDVQSSVFKNPSIDDAALANVTEDFCRSGNYFCKQHWSGKDEYIQIANLPDAVLLGGIRDIRDTLVSRYFHDRDVVKKFRGSMADYFAGRTARDRVIAFVRYFAFWHQGETTPVRFLQCYERMKSEPENALSGLLKVLDIDQSLASNLIAKTDMSTVKSSGAGSIFRKGEVGDHRDKLTEEQSSAILRWCEEANYATVKMNIVRQFPDLEPWLSQTDIGL